MNSVGPRTFISVTASPKPMPSGESSSSITLSQFHPASVETDAGGVLASSVPGTRDAGLQADGNPDFFKPSPRQPFVVVVHSRTSCKKPGELYYIPLCGVAQGGVGRKPGPHASQRGTHPRIKCGRILTERGQPVVHLPRRPLFVAPKVTARW